MTQKNEPPERPQGAVREDGYVIDFEDTRSFAAEKWELAVEAQEISPADRNRGRDVTTSEHYAEWIRTSMYNSKTPQQKSHLQSLLLITGPLLGFVDEFVRLVRPRAVDMSIIWSLIYLNISLAVPHNEKLKRITNIFGTLRRCFEALNQCIGNCSDRNSSRTQVTDAFDPLLGLLTGLLRFQRTYVTDSAFASKIHQIKEATQEHIEQIDSCVHHFRLMAKNTREQQDLDSKRFAFQGIPFRDSFNPYDRAAFPVVVLPDVRTDFFFGRQQCIERIDYHLSYRDKPMLRTYLIYGLRGVGKTQVALEYADRYRSKYDAVFWVQCETSASLRQSFSDIAVQLELSTQDQATRFEENQVKVLEWLKKTSKKWLLIYDNAEREQALNAYWPREANGSVLLTSRSYYNFEHQERRDGETLPVFTEQERWDLFMELLGADWKRRHLEGQNEIRERAAASKLLNHLGGLALAVSQAVKLVLDSRITGDQSIVTLLSLFEKASRELPPRFSGNRSATIHSLDTIFSIALNHVSNNARTLLGVFSMLAPDSIPVDLFLPADQTRLNGLLEFAKQDDPNTAALELSSAMADAVSELKAAGLIRQDGRTFVIHRVIQEAMNFHDLEDLQGSFNATTEVLFEAFPIQVLGRPLVTVWPRCQRYIQHVAHLTKSFTNYQKGTRGVVTATTNFVRLLSHAGWYLYEVAGLAECVEVITVARTATSDKESLLYSHLINTLGSAFSEQNKLKKARVCFAEARQLRERHLDPDHPQIATVLGNAGNVECGEGNLDEAQELFEQVARIRKKHGDAEIASLGLCFLQLGRVSYLRHDIEMAIKHYDKAEACFYRDSTRSRQYMADLHYARGNLELYGHRDTYQAIMQFEKCRDICHSLIPVHPLAAAAFYKLAICEMARGRRYHNKALLNLEKAYNIASIRSYGEVDGTVARIQWKRAEIMIDDPVQRAEGLKGRDGLKLDQLDIALELGVQIRPEWSDEEAFDMLVPGFFR